MLQRKQTFSILSQVVTIGVIRLSLLQDIAPIAMIDLLQVVNCWDGKFLTLVCANLMSFKYSLDYNTFCTFSESVVCLQIKICKVLIIMQGEWNPYVWALSPLQMSD